MAVSGVQTLYAARDPVTGETSGAFSRATKVSFTCGEIVFTDDACWPLTRLSVTDQVGPKTARVFRTLGIIETFDTHPHTIADLIYTTSISGRPSVELTSVVYTGIGSTFNVVITIGVCEASDTGVCVRVT